MANRINEGESTMDPKSPSVSVENVASQTEEQSDMDQPFLLPNMSSAGISGRGTVMVTGRITRGAVKVGETFEILRILHVLDDESSDSLVGPSGEPLATEEAKQVTTDIRQALQETWDIINAMHHARPQFEQLRMETRAILDQIEAV